MLLVFLLLKLAASTVLSYSPGKCISIPSNFSSTCSDIVDYTFFVANTTTIDAIESALNAKLSYTKIYSLPQACKVAVKMVSSNFCFS